MHLDHKTYPYYSNCLYDFFMSGKHSYDQLLEVSRKMMIWLEENIKSEPDHRSYRWSSETFEVFIVRNNGRRWSRGIAFKNAEDYVAFKLVWG